MPNPMSWPSPRASPADWTPTQSPARLRSLSRNRKRERVLAIESAKTATRVSGCGPAGLGQPADAFLLGWLACYARVSASGEQNVTSG